MNPTRPNILVFIVEQFRGDCLGCEGHPVLLTPTMDHIAGRGVRFSRAYSTCPICIPARRSFLTGRSPGTHGVVGWGIKKWRGPSIADYMREAGYQTAWIGRDMHQEPPNDPCGFATTILSGMGHPNNPYDQFLERNQPEGGGGYYGSGVMHNDWTARPWHLPEPLHHTNWVINETLTWLARRDTGRPFFLVVSFTAVHPPLVPPACYFERYIRTGVPEPIIGDWATPPEDGGIGMGPAPHKVDLKGEALLSARAGYYGLINHLDDQLNRVLNDVTGIQRMTGGNTAVFLTSDHGEMLGDHYFWRKSQPYEGAARIPLLVRLPERFGVKPKTVIDAPVGLEDILPTVLDLAGADIPDSIDGRSLLPLMRGDAGARDEWRPYIHIEHSPRFHALTDGRQKYVWFTQDGREQFFDLTRDPGERHDLAGSPEHAEALALWRQRMIEELKGRPEGFTDGRKLIPGRPYPPVMETSTEQARP